MVRLFVFLVLLLGLTTALAQNNYTHEIQAEFPGGVASMKRFLRRNIDTSLLNTLDPFFVSNNNKSVMCSFMVDTLGYVKNIKVERGVHPTLDKEAVRVINLMPRWEPSIRYSENTPFGKAVITQWNVPVSFEDPFYDDVIYRNVDRDPEFPGGTETLMKHLNICVEKYITPSEYSRFKNSFNDGLSPRTVCNFVIDREGEIRCLRILRGSEPALDKIALHVMSELPEFIPAENDGEKVCVSYTLSAFFKPTEFCID